MHSPGPRTLITKCCFLVLLFATGARGAITDNLVGYWKLNETSGTRADSLGVSNLTANNTPGSTGGVVGNCVQFTATSSQYLSAASNSSLQMSGNTSFTIAFWVQLIFATAQSLVTKDDDAASSRDYTIDYLSGSGLRFYIKGGATYIVTTAGTGTTGVWYFVVAWYDSSNGQLHLRLNDTTTYDAATTGATGTDVSAAQFRIGAREYLGAEDYANCFIDEVGIWKRVLTGPEITTLYNGGAGWTYPVTAVRPAFFPFFP